MGSAEISTGIIIQARMGSTRLPGKVLRDMAGTPLLGRILDRLAQLQSPCEVVVATTVEPRDEAIAAYCNARGTAVFRGSELNVLDRYVQCARAHGFDQIVRLTADNPFTDVAELDRLIATHLAADADFSHSFAALPIGVGAEVFRSDALEDSARRAHAPHHFEHVDEYLLEHPERYKTLQLSVEGPRNRPEVRLTVDDETDFRRACFILQNTDTAYVDTETAIALCSRFA